MKRFEGADYEMNAFFLPVNVQCEQVTSRRPYCKHGMFFPFVPPAVQEKLNRLVQLQEKFQRIIQLQEGNKQHDAFCPSGSLSMDLLYVTFFFFFVKATAVGQIVLLTW